MDRSNEIKEALRAADEALDSLFRARDYLGSAKNWGILDVLGGGLLTTLIKRGKMDEARREMEQARYALERFRSELNDVGQFLDIRFNERNLLAFADYFFDGILADLVVQNKISDAYVNVDRTIMEIQEIRQKLHYSLTEQTQV